MITSRRSSVSRLIPLFALAAAAFPASSAVAQNFNGITVLPRVFNDFTTTTLAIVNSNSIPGSVTINESNFSDDGQGGNFANRHDVLLSSDGGATGRVININTPFSLSADVSLTVGSNGPRKEAGIRINSPISGDALFIINSDAGEIVAFGGGAPFKLFGNNGGGNGYVPGTTITMGLNYTPGVPTTTGATPAFVEYFIDRNGALPGGFETSGPLAWSNLEGGPVDFTVGFYGQFSPNLQATPGDFANLSLTNINGVVPEPASAAILAAIGGLGMVRARRRA